MTEEPDDQDADAFPFGVGDGVARDISLGQRFRRARIKLSERQADFAKRFGVDQSTISKWEKGTQTPESYHIDLLANIETDEGTDVNDVSETAQNLFTLVPVVGQIGAGAVIHEIEGDRSTRAVGYVKAPRGFGAVEALRVRGDSMWPAYHDGDLVFIENRPADFPLVKGKEYILELGDGRQLLKMVEPHQGETYSLISYNAPPESGVTIKSARRVRYVRRA